MKTKITILFLFLAILTFSQTKKKLKNDLEDCKIENLKLNEALNKAVQANECITIEYPCDATRNDVKIAKIEAKKEKQIAKYEKIKYIKGLFFEKETDLTYNIFNWLTKAQRNIYLFLTTALFTGGAGALFIRNILSKIPYIGFFFKK